MRARALLSVVVSLIVSSCTDESTEPTDDSDASRIDASQPLIVADAANDAEANTRDANASDANASDASSAQGCAKRAYKLCEDFESAVDNTLPTGFSVVMGWGQGNPAVTSDEHHWGKKALKSASVSDGQNRAGRSLSSLGATAGKHWGRVFYKVLTPATLPSAGNVLHSTLVGLKGSNESRVVDTVINSSGKHQFLYNLPDDSCCTSSDYDYSFDGKWHCAEWYVDASNQSFRFFYDGSELTKLAFKYDGDQRAHIEAYGTIALGLMNYQKASPVNVAWLDDLAIDDTRIGCD